MAPQQSPASWRGTSAPTGSARLNRAFRLDRDETIPDGIRRVARGQLDQAHAELSQSPKRELATAVHDARKGLKRLRATVRLARGAIGEEIYRRENAAFRDNGRRLSGVRDASVLIETLDELEEVSGEDLPRAATARLRERLEQERKQALESLRADDSIVAAVAADIEKARTRTAAWTFELQGRKAMRRAQADATDESLHEWRKRVKDLWHVEQIMQSAAPRKMKKLAKRTHALSDLLGDDHDLAELRLYAGRHPDSFDDSAAQAGQIAVIDRRRSELQRRALALGRKLYRRSPRRFVATIERGWRNRARPAAAAA